MGTYVPNTDAQKLEMLDCVGCKDFDGLFVNIPENVRLKELNLPDGLSEFEVRRKMEGIAAKNKIYKSIFRGAGAYDRFIPAIVKSIVSKEEFVTAYTPYQAEISQGILQSIFEYQTAICRLTGLDTANASVYDGATAAAEAAAMCRERNRSKVLISATVNPMILSTVRTYCFGSGAEVSVVPEKDGVTDFDALKAELSDDSACFIFQSPNYFGMLEDVFEVSEAVHASGAKLVISCDPISLSVLTAPAEFGADVALGEGQPLGMPLSFGGPYLGFMAATAAMTRRLPGRIVGQTSDVDGKRGFVLTLQAREQHIRREKASSNICSNEALCALTASAYVAAMGNDGMKKAALQAASKAHYLADGLVAKGFKLKYSGEFFNEFVTVCDDSAKVLAALDAKGILGGLPLSETDILWCATEVNTKSDIDELLTEVAK